MEESKNGWCFDMSTAPRGTMKTVAGPKGDREVFVRDVIFVAGKPPHVTQSYWIPKEGRWCMFTKECPPIAWHPFPKHPITAAREAAHG